MKSAAKNKYIIPLIYLLLMGATLAVYLQVRGFDFVDYDDTAYVTENPQVQSGLTRQSVAWALTTHYFANWHPLTWLSHMLDCELFGMKAGMHHLTNVALHIANTLLLFTVLLKMTGKAGSSGFVAAAFALHPLHVDSVAWISERKDMLSTFGWMLCLYAYIGYVQRKNVRWYLLSLLLFVLGLTAKPMLVTLPFVLLLLDYWPLNRWKSLPTYTDIEKTKQPAGMSAAGAGESFYHLVGEKIPFFIIAAAFCVVTFLVQRSGGAVESFERLTFGLRVENALVSYIKYVGKTVWPSKLAVFYPHLRGHLPGWQAAGAGLVILVITLGIIFPGRRYRWLTVGWLWFLGTLIPVIGLIQVGDQALADRYSYIPLIGLFIIAAWGAEQLLSRWRYKKIALTAAGAGAILAMTAVTNRQLGYWRNSATLFNHALAVTDNNYVAHNGLGTVYFKQRNYDKALFHYQETLRIAPGHPDAPGNLGLTLLQLGRFEEAAGQFRRALARKGDVQKWHWGLGAALQKTGKIDEAIEQYHLALKLDENDASAHNNLAIALDQKGEKEQALKHFMAAVRLEPNDKEYQKNLKKALAQAKKNNLEETVR